MNDGFLVEDALSVGFVGCFREGVAVDGHVMLCRGGFDDLVRGDLAEIFQGRHLVFFHQLFAGFQRFFQRTEGMRRLFGGYRGAFQEHTFEKAFREG